MHASYTPERTNLQIGFDIDPALLRGNETSGEIYDITLTDQTGREIPGESTTRVQPELAEAEFAPLPQGVTELTLSAELVLHGVPTDGPLVIDLSGRQAGDSWPIQATLYFGDLPVQLHTARCDPCLGNTKPALTVYPPTESRRCMGEREPADPCAGLHARRVRPR